MNNKTTLILGGARSGKSSYAEELAEQSRFNLVYIATGEPSDEEMRARIDHHRDRRCEKWETIEEPVDIASVINEHSTKDTVILVDCLTIWTSNLMFKEKCVQEAGAKLIIALRNAPGPVLLVSNEVGQGIVPQNALARNFRDEAGRLNQRLAAVVPNVDYIVAGLPLSLKKNAKIVSGNIER